MPKYTKPYSGISCTIVVEGAVVSAIAGGVGVFNETCVKGGATPAEVIRAADDACKTVAASMKAQSDAREVSAEAKADTILTNKGYVLVPDEPPVV